MANREQLEALVDESADAQFALSLAGIVLAWNRSAEQLFGYTAAEAIGQSAIELIVPPDDRARAARELSDVVVRIALRHVAGAEPFVVAAASRDSTERQLIEAKTHEANRLKSEFLANMSHELRTPLNAIIGFTELMHRGKAGPLEPDQQEYLGDILSSAKHLLQLINDVLELAKVESGKMELRPVEVDVAQLVGEVRDVLRGLAAAKRQLVMSVIDPAVTRVRVDPARVKQVLYNFMSNAIKFTPSGGTIEVHARPAERPELFRLEVRDTGIGIAPENIPKLFVEFQQLDAGSAKRYQGTGLGLALTKQIVEGHGGHVEVTSEPGVGSTFAAVLPRSPPTGAGTGGA